MYVSQQYFDAYLKYAYVTSFFPVSDQGWYPLRCLTMPGAPFLFEKGKIRTITDLFLLQKATLGGEESCQADLGIEILFSGFSTPQKCYI